MEAITRESDTPELAWSVVGLSLPLRRNRSPGPRYAVAPSLLGREDL
jgi:hypothetical protein